MKTLDYGEYVDLKVDDDGDLHILLVSGGRGQIWKRGLLFIPEEEAIHELLEDHLCNGWESVRPEEVGALTSATLLAYDVERDDKGELTFAGSVYWDQNYQVRSTIRTLYEEGEIVWKGVEGG